MGLTKVINTNVDGIRVAKIPADRPADGQAGRDPQHDDDTGRA